MIKSIKNENDVLISRISSVTYYSSLINSDHPLNLVESDINDVIFASLAGRDGYYFEPEEPVYVHFDFNLVKRALKEVFDNADNYGTKGEKISVRVRKTDKDVTLIVMNKGKLPDPRPPFFEPWARGDESRHEGGSGLGLPIVHQIMEMHHGSVSIDENDGYVFVTLTFPV